MMGNLSLKWPKSVNFRFVRQLIIIGRSAKLALGSYTAMLCQLSLVAAKMVTAAIAPPGVGRSTAKENGGG